MWTQRVPLRGCYWITVSAWLNGDNQRNRGAVMSKVSDPALKLIKAEYMWSKDWILNTLGSIGMVRFARVCPCPIAATSIQISRSKYWIIQCRILTRNCFGPFLNFYFMDIAHRKRKIANRKHCKLRVTTDQKTVIIMWHSVESTLILSEAILKFAFDFKERNRTRFLAWKFTSERDCRWFSASELVQIEIVFNFVNFSCEVLFWDALVSTLKFT